MVPTLPVGPRRWREPGGFEAGGFVGQGGWRSSNVRPGCLLRGIAVRRSACGLSGLVAGNAGTARGLERSLSCPALNSGQVRVQADLRYDGRTRSLGLGWVGIPLRTGIPSEG